MIDGIDFADSFQHPSIPPLLFITTLVNNQRIKILIDTGAQHSFINEECLRSNDQFKHFNVEHQKFYLADGLTSFFVTGTVPFEHSNRRYYDNRSSICYHQFMHKSYSRSGLSF
jgi:hypothetical protein